ncbi:MAG: hypothetical protein IJ307_01425, partial [Bacteroidales bacterium]|nr:hypothetical protein [Bacteroidales bacterium]
ESTEFFTNLPPENRVFQKKLKFIRRHSNIRFSEGYILRLFFSGLPFGEHELSVNHYYSGSWAPVMPVGFHL